MAEASEPVKKVALELVSDATVEKESAQVPMEVSELELARTEELALGSVTQVALDSDADPMAERA